MTTVADPRVPKFSDADAVLFAREYYGLEAESRQLPSYIDNNFALTTTTGEKFVLKIANTHATESLLDFQNQVMERITAAGVTCSRVRKSLTGKAIIPVEDKEGRTFLMRLLTWVSGTFMVRMDRHPPEFLHSLGRALGAMDKALTDFTHPAMRRTLSWDLARISQVRPVLADIADDRRRALATRLLDAYEADGIHRFKKLRTGVIHNDANDHNILTENGLFSGLIDMGDVCYTQLIGELAVACAYVVMGKPKPLVAAAHVVAGYHRVYPLLEEELDLLFIMIQMRLVNSVAMSARQIKKEPENHYLLVSEEPAWNALQKLSQIHPHVARGIFRTACDLDAHPATEAVVNSLKARREHIGKVVDPPMEGAVIINLGPHGDGEQGFIAEEGTDGTTGEVFDRMRAAGSELALGRYNENRNLYGTGNFMPADGSEPRTVHIGVDLFLMPGSPVYAPLDAAVHSFADNAERLDYGPTIILEHRLDEVVFYSLYGHLSPDSLDGLHVGKQVNAGERIASIGAAPRNGGWAPHLHFQLMVDMLDKQGDFPGVAKQSERGVWLDLCPDPNLILNHPELSFARAGRNQRELRDQRQRHLGRMLSLSYNKPLKMVRGRGQYLYDDTGRCFLDMVNNVCHVGHCHSRVVAAAQQQIAALNTNTRYLHDNIVAYAERLTATLPDPLSVVFLVNSGSEANDLALRMARAHTGGHDVIVIDVAYHGHLSSMIDLSPYKFNSKGGQGKPDHVHVAPMPDGYRGPVKHGDPEIGPKYAKHVARAVEQAVSRGKGLAAFFAESILGCGGQVLLPPGYLKAAYAHVREAGGVCVADEVQVGFGRVGSHMWAFELQGVVPDIVTMGKPIGNGHPMAAVVTTPKIAASFNNGMEYFNTFGGNPVSSAVGLAVLDVIAEENLRENAAAVGDVLIGRLKDLAPRFPIIGEVRGVGLFIGVELVLDHETLEPAPKQAKYIVERLCEEDILLSIDGPLYNVLKIKPPICFSETNAHNFADTLERILAEPDAQP
ncbi:MAG: aminotransferase class III-fold pyridoxal phosphate-dependent enzyme [Acidobacteriota bacterium]|nr:aminotransferase class III-fold pyridoxal phosphate-dependent enzyme [Acidobacteriota bacterium]